MSVKTIWQTGGEDNRRWLNRRVFVRYQCAPATPGKIVSEDGDQLVMAWVQDLSKRGAGLTLSFPLPHNQEIIIQISSPSTNERHEIGATVVHVSRHINGDWMAGIQFAHEISDDLLDTLLY